MRRAQPQRSDKKPACGATVEHRVAASGFSKQAETAELHYLTGAQAISQLLCDEKQGQHLAQPALIASWKWRCSVGEYLMEQAVDNEELGQIV